MSWRRHSDNINLIVTANSDFAVRHRAATHLCKRLNLAHKADRIALFQAVLYAAQWNESKGDPATPISVTADAIDEMKF